MDSLQTREAIATLITVICGTLAASNIVSQEVADALKVIALAAIPSIAIFCAHKLRRGGVPFRPLPVQPK